MEKEIPLQPGDRAEKLRVSQGALRWRCDPAELSFASTADVEPLRGIIGQEDALDSLRFGLEIFAPGQNVFVRGLTGTGRMSLVRRVLEEIQPACPLAGDFCYVTNFERPEAPQLVALERGQGFAFRDAIDRLVQYLAKELGPALASDDLRARRQLLDDRFEAAARSVSKPFEEKLAENGLAMATVQIGSNTRPMILPIIDGEPAPPERIQELRAAGTVSAAELDALQEKISVWAKELEATSARMSEIGREHAEEVRRLVQEEVRALLEAETRPLRETFGQAHVGPFLDALVDDVIRHGVEDLANPDVLRRYRVNVVLGHHEDDGCPVIVENAPSVANLLGSVDRRVLADGLVVSDHLMISAGSLLRADGGYLILEAREILREPGAWRVLLRTLRSGCLEIVPADLMGPWSTRTLKPEPIPLQVKVVLIGDPGLYYLLDAQDPEFPHLFKVLADFDSSIQRSPESVEAYAGLLARIATDEDLPHFDRGAVALLAEHGARIAGNNQRLTTRFGRLTDIAREAAFLTSRSADDLVSADTVRETIRRVKRRGDLPARKYRRMRLRSMDVQMLRILEEISAGRQESMGEIRADLANLSNAIRTLGRGRGSFDGS